MRIPDDSALVFKAGHRPIYAGKIRYFEESALLERARIPAPAQSDRIGDVGSPWDRSALSPKPGASAEGPTNPTKSLVELLHEKKQGADEQSEDNDLANLAVHNGQKLV
jgi:type IV secretory pathway TraG/TraD family ATPase VirD4